MPTPARGRNSAGSRRGAAAGTWRRIARLVVLTAGVALTGEAHAASDSAECSGGGDRSAAIAACTRLIESRATTAAARVEAYGSRGRRHYEAGQLDRAVADYTEAIRLDPGNVTVLSRRSLAYHDQGDPDRAVADASEAIRLDPTYGSAYTNRGLAYHAKGDLARAVADATEAMRLLPGDAKPHNNRGNAYFARGDLDRAMADFDAAIRLDPGFALAYHNRGLAHRNKGDLDRAIADATQAVRLDGASGVFRGDRGELYFHRGDVAHAIADFNEALRLDRSDTRHLFWRGVAHVYAGDLARARDDLTGAIPQFRAYGTLWLEIVERRSRRPSSLSENASRLDMRWWPAPLVRLFLGQSTQAAVLAAARSEPDPSMRQRKVCETNFYGGALALLQDRKNEAARLFALAAGECPRDPPELSAAKLELSALGLSAPIRSPVVGTLPSSCLAERLMGSRSWDTSGNGPNPFGPACRR
jgi:tetratricopeptide (TPR) repeat protein